MRGALAFALLLVPLLPLGGCGRAGPPRAPGPAEAVTYPRTYPAPPARPEAPPAPP